MHRSSCGFIKLTKTACNRLRKLLFLCLMCINREKYLIANFVCIKKEYADNINTKERGLQGFCGATCA